MKHSSKWIELAAKFQPGLGHLGSSLLFPALQKVLLPLHSPPVKSKGFHGSFVKNNRLKSQEVLRWCCKAGMDVLQTSGGQTETALGTREPQEAPGAQINTPEQLLGHPPANLQNKGGNLMSCSVPRLEIGNSGSWCYSSSPHDHDSGEQQKPHQMETVELDKPPIKGFKVFRGELGQKSWRLRQDTKPPC